MDGKEKDLLRYLGRDVWMQILEYLDLKSLGKLCCTSATWNSFIENVESAWRNLYKRHQVRSLPNVVRDVSNNYRNLFKFWTLKDDVSDGFLETDSSKSIETLFFQLLTANPVNSLKEVWYRLFREKLFSLHPQYYYSEQGMYPKYIFEMEWATSSKSQCFLCKYMIMTDTLRFHLAFKGRQSIRYCHASCLIWKRINQPEEEYEQVEGSTRADVTDTRSIVIGVNEVGDMKLEEIDQLTKWVIRKCPVEDTPEILGVQPPFAAQKEKKRASSSSKQPKKKHKKK